MLRRDFTKSNKEYLNKNKVVIMAVAAFLLLGLIVGLIFGMNGNFEVKGYNEFSVTITENKVGNYSEYSQEISKIVNSYDAKFDTVSISGEGDNTQLVVRYLNDVSYANEIEINAKVAQTLGVETDKVSVHSFVKPILQKTDVIFTVVAILVVILGATILSYVRYNGASAMAMIIGCLLGTFGFMSIGAILRLAIGMSYLAMLVILNMLIVYFAINIFEGMHKSRWLMSDDYAKAIDTSLRASKFRLSVLSVAVMLIGTLFVIIAPVAIKYIALNVMFMAVVLLAVSWYVVPFVWSVFITRCRKREYKVKASGVETKKDDKN